MKRQFYKSHSVWEHISEKEIGIFNIFQGIDDNLYYVQSYDVYRNGESNVFFDQKLELFAEIDPKIRTKGYETIEMAVLEFKKDFE